MQDPQLLQGHFMESSEYQIGFKDGLEHLSPPPLITSLFQKFSQLSYLEIHKYFLPKNQ